MRITIALCFVFGLASVSMGQCLNGTCNLAPKVADTVRAVVSVPVRLVASVASVEMENSLAEVAAVEEHQAVARRTPVRSFVASRPLRTLGCGLFQKIGNRSAVQSCGGSAAATPRSCSGSMAAPSGCAGSVIVPPSPSSWFFDL